MRKYEIPMVLAICIISFLILSYNFNTYAQDEGRYVEEDADTVLPGDEVITGVVTRHKDSIMLIDKEKYHLCNTVQVFDEKGQAVKKELLREAQEVKVFYSKRKDCVRKVKVLKFKS